MKKRPWKTGHRAINPNIEHESGIQSARMALNMTWDELRIAIGLDRSGIQSLYRLSTGESPPIYETTTGGHYAGEVKQIAIDVSEALGAPLEDLFPRYICRIKTDSDELTAEQLEEFTVSDFSSTAADGGREIEEGELSSNLHRAINETLHTLTPREEMVLRRRFGIDRQPETLTQIAPQLGVTTRESVRVIEARALCKLSRPSRKAMLK